MNPPKMGVNTVTLMFSMVFFLLGLSPSTQEPVLIKGGWNGRDDVTVERNVTKLTFGEKMLAGSLARVVAQEVGCGCLQVACCGYQG